MPVFTYRGRPFQSIAEHARRLHSAWLTRAIRRGGGRGLPRIPARRVSDGGYGPLVATTEGREWAEAWWADALALDDAG